MLNGKRPLLGAVLIVKNEIKTIEAMLHALVDKVETVTVLDTGSTDGTLEVLRKVKGPNFHFGREEFTNYADMRNLALDVAAECNPSVFTLTLSSDEKLVGAEELRAFLEAHREFVLEGAYCIMMRSGPRQWPFPRILRTGAGWKFVNTAGGRHEQPVGPTGEIEGQLIPGVSVVHEESDPARKAVRLREKDLPDLTAVVEDESKPLEDRAEAMFQLAETHFVLGHGDYDANGKYASGGRWLSHKFASMALYTRYAELAEVVGSKIHDAQRAMYARLMYCYVAETFGLFEPSELVKRLSLVAAAAPQLPEAHWLLAKNAAKVDVRKAIPLAMRAAKVARAVYERPVHGPVDMNIEWQAYLLAADCSRIIKDKRLQHSFAKQALAAGAPRDIVGDLAGPAS